MPWGRPRNARRLIPRQGKVVLLTPQKGHKSPTRCPPPSGRVGCGSTESRATLRTPVLNPSSQPRTRPFPAQMSIGHPKYPESLKSPISSKSTPPPAPGPAWRRRGAGRDNIPMTDGPHQHQREQPAEKRRPPPRRTVASLITSGGRPPEEETAAGRDWVRNSGAGAEPPRCPAGWPASDTLSSGR